MFKYRFFLLLGFFIFLGNVNAQQQVGLHFMDIWQNSKTNPAYISNQKIVAGLPGFHLNYYNTTGDFNSLLVDYLNDETGIQPQNELNDLPETNNILRGVLEVETINFGYQLGNIQLGFSHMQKTDLYLNFPKTLAKLFLEGNGQYIGQTVDISHDMKLTAYNEFALSGAMKLSKFNIGARVKLLTGIADATVGNQDVSLYTDDDIYQLTLTGDYDVNVSRLLNFNDLESFNLSLQSFSFNDLMTKNTGLAFDLGVTYQVNKKLSLSASILDLGKINWSENVNQYSNDGETTYDGFDFAQFTTNDSISFGSAIDTLQATFNFSKKIADYSTTLPTKIYVSGNYQLSEKIRLGGLFYYEKYRDQSFPIFGLSGNMQLLKNLNIGATYSGRKESFINLGLNFVFNYKILQLYATTDNIVAAFQPYKSSNVNFRTGLNLLF